MQINKCPVCWQHFLSTEVPPCECWYRFIEEDLYFYSNDILTKGKEYESIKAKRV